MSRIDYSKWDDIQDSDDEKEGYSGGPEVTTLDQPSQIVTVKGEQGFSVVPAAAAAPKGPVPTPTKPTSTKGSGIPSAWTEKGGVAKPPVAGATKATTLYWAQDRYSVTLRTSVEDGSQFHVSVQGILPYTDRNCAASTTDPPRLTVSRKVNKSDNLAPWLEGDLPHAVHLDQDEEDIDWSIERLDGVRYISLTLNKAVPMDGVFVWWKRPLLLCPETEWRNESKDSSAFQQAWKDAHTQFQKNITKKEKTTI